MSGNVKFRWFLLAPLLVALFVVVTSPVVSWAGELEDAKEDVRKYPNDSAAHYNLGLAYDDLGQYQNTIASYKEGSGIDILSRYLISPGRLRNLKVGSL